MGIIAGIKNVLKALDTIGTAAGVGRTLPGQPPVGPSGGVPTSGALATPAGPAPVPVATSTKVPGGGAIADYKILGPSTITLTVFREALLHHASPAVVDIENTHISLDMADEL